MIGRCDRCGVIARLIAHHLLGRVGGRPIHPASLNICEDCHADEHEVWRALAVNGASDHPVVLVRRLAIGLGRFGHETFAEAAAAIAERMEQEP